jgi:hypothetical protein
MPYPPKLCRGPLIYAAPYLATPHAESFNGIQLIRGKNLAYMKNTPRASLREPGET